MEKVTKFAAVIVNVVLTLTKAGRLNVVNEANDAATEPVIFAKDVNVTVVADAQTGAKPAPNVVSAGKLNVVNAAKVGANAPVTVVKLVTVNDVKAANVGINVPLTVTKLGILTVAKDVPTGAKFPPVAIDGV
jgi:hypothetical protein